MSKITNYIKKDKIRSIITAIVLVLLIGAVVVLGVKLSRQTTTTRIGAEAYQIGIIDETTGEYSNTEKTSITLRNAITVDGLSCKLATDSKVTYKLFFYNSDGEFIEAVEGTAAFDRSDIPEGAETVNVMITPTEDADGTVSWSEIYGYANQLTVIVNK